MLNKGFEVIEASHLFHVPFNQIEVVIHPQAIIHSFVEFIDGYTKAVLSKPQMNYAIQYALTYPQRQLLGTPYRHYSELKNLSFLAPDPDKFPLLELCYAIGAKGGLYPALLNTASEVIIDLFLNNKISFGMIPSSINKILHHFGNHFDFLPLCLESIINVDNEVRRTINNSFWS